MGYIGKVTDTNGSTHLVGSTLYGTCSTASGTPAKVVTCSDFRELVTGVTIHVKFNNANLTTEMGVTLNVNNTGAKTVIGGLSGDTLPGQGFRWASGCVVSFTYDGTYWVMNDSYLNASTDTKVTQTATTTNSDYPILFKYSANQTDETTQVRFGNTTGKVPKINPGTGDISTCSLNGIVIMGDSNGFSFANSGADLNVGPSSFSIFNDENDGTCIMDLNWGSARTLSFSDSYALAAACAKGVDTSISSGSSSTNLPTTAAVVNYINGAVTGATAFQGSLVQTDSGSSATKWTQAELEAASYVKGWYWVCETAGTYAGNVLEAGDMLFCVSDKSSAYSASDFTAIQNNIETLTTTEIDNFWAAA